MVLVDSDFLNAETAPDASYELVRAWRKRLVCVSLASIMDSGQHRHVLTATVQATTRMAEGWRVQESALERLRRFEVEVKPGEMMKLSWHRPRTLYSQKTDATRFSPGRELRSIEPWMALW